MNIYDSMVVGTRAVRPGSARMSGGFKSGAESSESVASGPKSLAFLVRRARLVSALVVVLVAASSVAVSFLPGSGTAPPVTEFGTAIVDFSIVTIDGETFRLSDELARGRVVFLDFMYVNCPACRTAMPHLLQLRSRFTDEDLTMISIDLNPRGDETEADLVGFRDEFQAPWHFALDRSGELRQEFKVEGYPSVMMVTPQGQIAFYDVGITGAPLLIEVAEELVRRNR